MTEICSKRTFGALEDARRFVIEPVKSEVHFLFLKNLEIVVD